MTRTLDQLFDLVPDALVLVDRDGTIAKANEHADRLFHYPPGGLLGRAVETLIPADLRSRHHEHRANYRTNPKVRPMGAGSQTLSGLRGDGSVFPVEIALSPLELEDATYYVASIRDVSESQRARQAMVRARYDRLVAQVGQQALLAADGDVLLAALPGELCEALGVRACAVYAQDHAGNLRLTAGHGIDDEWVELQQVPIAALDASLAENAPQLVRNAATSTATLATRLRGLGFMSALIVPLVERGRILGALMTLDPAPGRFDQDEVHCVQSICNVVSAMLLRRRAEDELAHAQRLEAIGQLTGGIAHDFNNLLTVVSGNLQLMELNRSVDADMRELIGDALRAVDHGASLTAKLLAFGRRQRLSPRQIDVGRLLLDMASMLRRTLGDAIHVTVDVEPGLPPLYADAAQLDAALLNLALNSRDAMPRGGDLALRAGAVREVPDGEGDVPHGGPFVCIAVIDTGTGMPDDVLARAFEPFFTTKDAGKGNGLGLSMAYGFARQSGGLLRARSQLGYGTRMELFLPVAGVGERAPAAGEPGTATVAGHVLVVEDEAAVRQVATRFLQSLGLQVTAVGTAEEAIGHLQDDRSITTLFTDISLGAGMSGSELARRAARSRPDVAVLLTTGFDRDGVQAERDGAFPLLPKPYHRVDLEKALAALGRR